MKIIDKITAHKTGGWQGRYNRMIRWINRFEELHSKELINESKSDIYFDTMYVCFQNIFFLKDWLKEKSILTNSELNGFINQNTEIGLCRDICNGTKHFNINNPSVDNEFGIIREFNAMSEFNSEPKIGIIILADGQKYKPLALIRKCVELWNEFIPEKLNLKLEKASS